MEETEGESKKTLQRIELSFPSVASWGRWDLSAPVTDGRNALLLLYKLAGLWFCTVQSPFSADTEADLVFKGGLFLVASRLSNMLTASQGRIC